MNLLVLLGLFISLVIILAFLIFLFLMKAKKKDTNNLQKKKIGQKSEYRPLQEYINIIKDKSSTSEDLQGAVNNILKYYGTIHSKLGLRTHPDFTTYAMALFQICRHPNTNKDIILQFNRTLEQKNPSYKREINDAITKGLNSRG